MEQEKDIKRGNRVNKQEGEKDKEQKKGQGSKQEEKQDSVWIAKQLLSGEEENIGKRLMDFRQIKNSNLEKFTKRIQDNLFHLKLTFGASIDRFMMICRQVREENTTTQQLGAILNGFFSFWKQCKVEEQDMFDLFYFIEGAPIQVGRKFIIVCSRLIDLKMKQIQFAFGKGALEMVNKMLKANRWEQSKILTLIAEFELYTEVPSGRIIDLVQCYNNITEALFIFEKGNEVRLDLLRMLVDRSVNRGDKADLTRCQTLIRGLKVDPFQFDNYITKMQERYINYLVRTYKLYQIELIIKYDRTLLLLLIDQLRNRRRDKQRQYFIIKYGFEKALNFHCTKQQRQSILNIRNILIDNDYFGPTQVEVLQEVDSDKEEEYLYMGDFGLSEKDVFIIDSSNIDQINIEQQFTGKIGIDEERGGGTHVFDDSKTSILQLYNGRRVFIFDTLELKNHETLKKIFEHIFSFCHIYGQEIIKELTAMQRNMKLDIPEKVMQHLLKDRVTESNKLFKQLFPKEKRSSLAFLCEFVLKKKLSKYEQCSGWLIRPLRKAQIHYAALDCIVPYKICEELLKMNKPTKS